MNKQLSPTATKEEEKDKLPESDKSVKNEDGHTDADTPIEENNSDKSSSVTEENTTENSGDGTQSDSEKQEQIEKDKQQEKEKEEKTDNTSTQPEKPKERKIMLRDKHVKEYLDKKAQDEADVEAIRKKLAPKAAPNAKPAQNGGAAPGAKPGATPAAANSAAPRAALAEGVSSSEKMEKLDDVMDGIGSALGHTTDAGNIIADGLEAGNVKDQGFGNYFGLASGVANTAVNAYGLGRSIYGTKQSAQNGDKVGKTVGIFNSIGSALGTASSITTVGSSIGSIAGGSEQSGNIGNIVSGSLDFFGNMSSFIGSSIQSSASKLTKEKMSGMRAKVSDKDLKNASSNSTKARNNLTKNKDKATAEDLNAFDRARQARNAAKARKYAAGMAERAAEGKRKSALGDTFSNLAGMFSALTGVAGGAAGMLGSPWAKFAMSALGGLINLIPTVLKAKNKAEEKKSAAANKDTTVKEYFDRKRTAVMAAINGNSENEKITAGEADNIIIGRLGIDSDAGIDPESHLQDKKDDIFSKLCEKRAENIHQADDATRKEILESLGLDPQKATKQAIISALGG